MNMRLQSYFQLIFILALMVFSGCNSIRKDFEPRPNFILIYTDEMQFSDLGCYGGNIPTPNIDKLAEDGIRFTSAYTVASMCTPSRYSVITGQFPGRCTSERFLKESPKGEPYNVAWNTSLTPDKMTIQKVLSDQGYETGMAGKWHISKVPATIEMPKLSADDELDDPEVEMKLKTQQSTYQMLLKEAGFTNPISVLWGNFDGQKIKALNFHNFPWMTKGGLSFLDAQKDEENPFFLYFAPTAVHGPNHYQDLSMDVTYTPGGRDMSLANSSMDMKALKEKIDAGGISNKHRYAGVAITDYSLGQLMQKLQETGKADNTVIIFMADHNIEPGKATSYEKGIHVPMIIYWPGKASGAVSDALVQNTDIYPTILEAAGIPIPEGYITDGISMLPVIDNPERSTRKYLFSENGYTRSVTNGTYKYIALRFPKSLVKSMESGQLDHVPSYVKAWPQSHSAIAVNSYPRYFDQDQLYNLDKDPFEMNNLFKEMAESEILEELKQALKEHLARFEHPFDLEPIPFLETEEYDKLTKKNLEFDVYSIPWLSRDHGKLTWPAEL